MSSCAVHFWACHFIMHASHTYCTRIFPPFSSRSCWCSRFIWAFLCSETAGRLRFWQPSSFFVNVTRIVSFCSGYQKSRLLKRFCFLFDALFHQTDCDPHATYSTVSVLTSSFCESAPRLDCSRHCCPWYCSIRFFNHLCCWFGKWPTNSNEHIFFSI